MISAADAVINVVKELDKEGISRTYAERDLRLSEIA